MNCSVPANQPIYQALLDRAASYPADKPYQAKAYKKAAEAIATFTRDLYEGPAFRADDLPGIGFGWSIKDFINKFIKANPRPTDDAARAASKAAERTEVLAALNKALGLEPNDNPAMKPAKPTQPKWSTIDYTAENPRRSKRNVGKPAVKYFTEEDEQDETAEAIEAICAKKGWKYSDELVAEFNTWLPTAEEYNTHKYDSTRGEYVPKTKLEIIKHWAMSFSISLQKQLLLQKFNKAIVKYCQKKGLEYSPLMDNKFVEWWADPTNKNLVTDTYSASTCCNCSFCQNDTTKKPYKLEYSYDRSPDYCVKMWFSTLKMTVAF